MLRKLLLTVTIIAAFKVPFAFSQVEFEPPVIISPANPVAGQPVYAALAVEFNPPCLLLPQENSIGETLSVIINKNTLELNALAFPNPICFPIPISPTPREFYPLGLLEAGEFTLLTNYISVGNPESVPPFPLPDFFIKSPYGPPVTFTVRSAPSAVNVLTVPGLVVLILGVLLTVFVSRNA